MAARATGVRDTWGYAQERWYLRALIGAALVSLLLTLVIVWIEWGGTPTDKRVALTFLINLVAVIGFQVFMGNSGVPTFGHVGFVAIGAYTAALLTTPTVRKTSPSLIPDAPSFLLNAEFGLIPSLLMGILMAVLVAGVFGLVIVRLRGGSAAIATLALLLIIRNVLGNWEEITRGPKTWSGIPEFTTVWVALLVAVAAIFVARFFRESGVGLRLRATRTDELASSAVGVDIARARYVSWVLSAGIAGAAGVLWAHYFLSLAPQDFFFSLTFLYIVMVIIGGPSVSGAVVGAGAITLVTEFVRRSETGGIHLGPLDFDQVFGLTPVVLGLLVLITVIKRPDGILGRWELDEVLAKANARIRAWRSGPEPRAPATVGAEGLNYKDEELGAVGTRQQGRTSSSSRRGKDKRSHEGGENE
jgi:branched-chain amino acid transport system permease protein